MKENGKKFIIWGCILLIVFIAFTVSLRFVDVRPIGPNDSSVAYGALNGVVAKMFPMNETLYIITDWAGIVPFLFVFCFALTGLVQWIKRKSIAKVDGDILVLGGVYLLAFGAYVLFEFLKINYRPVLIEGILEASYPSSTTMLSLCVLPTVAMQLYARVRCTWLRKASVALLLVFTVFMVGGRLISGVHWFTDIFGGCLYSGALLLLYRGGTMLTASCGTKECGGEQEQE